MSTSSTDTFTLTDPQISQFREAGYLILPDFFSAQETQAMVAELERFKREGLGRNVATDGDGQTLSQIKVNYQIIPLNNKSTLLRALPFAPKVKYLIGSLIGEPFARNLDQIFLKPGRSGVGTDWHTDNGYFQLSDPSKGMALWIALHDSTLANGTLHVIPGSDKMTFAHERDSNSNHHIHISEGLAESEAVPAILRAGGVVCFNYGTAHATKENTTDQERAGLAFHFVRTDYIPDGSNHFKDIVHIAGPAASGGQNEYGLQIDGTWQEEVTRLI
jgi:ectoine hydroxylase